KAARDLVTRPAELPARVEHREHDLGRRLRLVLRVGIDGDAPAVVDDAAPAVAQDGDVDPGGVTGHGLVDGVVDDLVHEVVQAVEPGGPDVHAGSLPDGLQTLENGDVLRPV